MVNFKSMLDWNHGCKYSYPNRLAKKFNFDKQSANIFESYRNL